MIDTHCHLNDNSYDGEVNQIVENYLNAGIEKVICIGCDPISNLKAKEIAKEYTSVFYAVGIHPDDCDSFNILQLEEYLKQDDSKLLAIGEIGLDYHNNKESKEKQKEVFIEQIKLANKYNLPIIIHCRDAYGDMLEILNNYPVINGGVMHCYSGSLEFANQIIKMGFKLSFTGSVTFKNAKNLHEVAKNIPIDSFFFETDSPYLTPEPNRGKRNEPKNVIDVAKFVADLRGISFKNMAEISDKNAKEFFRLK